MKILVFMCDFTIISDLMECHTPFPYVICLYNCYWGPWGPSFFKNREGVPNSPMVGLFGTLWEYKRRGPLKASILS